MDVWSLILGVLFVSGGSLTLVLRGRMVQAVRDPKLREELGERPRANPLRWFYIWIRFLGASGGRIVAWGLFQVAVGAAFLVGAIVLR